MYERKQTSASVKGAPVFEVGKWCSSRKWYTSCPLLSSWNPNSHPNDWVTQILTPHPDPEPNPHPNLQHPGRLHTGSEGWWLKLFLHYHQYWCPRGYVLSPVMYGFYTPDSTATHSSKSPSSGLLMTQCWPSSSLIRMRRHTGKSWRSWHDGVRRRTNGLISPQSEEISLFKVELCRWSVMRRIRGHVDTEREHIL